MGLLLVASLVKVAKSSNWLVAAQRRVGHMYVYFSTRGLHRLDVRVRVDSRCLKQVLLFIFTLLPRRFMLTYLKLAAYQLTLFFFCTKWT